MSDKNVNFKLLWLKDQFEKIRLAIPKEEISSEDLKKYLLKKYESRYLSDGRFYNNTDNSNVVMNQEEFINKFINSDLILSGYACLYENQDNAENISSKALNFLLTSRKKYKKMQGEAEYGSNAYTYYKVMQLTYKLLANSYYGILGEKNSAFYNPFVQNSITTTGQDLITTSIIGMEAFLSNNVPFADINDILEFIRNVKTETPELNILEYVDKKISVDELEEYLLSKCRNPGVIDREILRDSIKNLSDEILARLFYKNRVLTLCKNKWFEEKLKNMVQYVYAEEPAEEQKDDLNAFRKAVIDFCHYNYLFEDRYKRAVQDKRHSIITIDTDSNFINLNKYIQEVTKKFNLDKENQDQQMTIFNIFMNVVTEILSRMFWKLTTNMGLIDSAKPIIAMKPEFVYKRIMLTRNKKSLKKFAQFY